MAALLEHANGDQVGILISLDRDELTIGRADDCSIVTEPEFTSVSRRHAILRKSSVGWTITDIGTLGTGSSYGTYLNRKRLIPNVQTVLHVGDVIQLGTKLGKYFRFRGSGTVTTSLPPNVGDRICLDKGKRQVIVDGRAVMISLTPHEFDFLLLLWQKRGNICSFREICEILWPGEKVLGPSVVDSDMRVRVNTVAYAVRRKIGTTLDGLDLLENCRGIGYRWRV